MVDKRPEVTRGKRVSSLIGSFRCLGKLQHERELEADLHVISQRNAYNLSGLGALALCPFATWKLKPRLEAVIIGNDWIGAEAAQRAAVVARQGGVLPGSLRSKTCA